MTNDTSDRDSEILSALLSLDTCGMSKELKNYICEEARRLWVHLGESNHLGSLCINCDPFPVKPVACIDACFSHWGPPTATQVDPLSEVPCSSRSCCRSGHIVSCPTAISFVDSEHMESRCAVNQALSVEPMLPMTAVTSFVLTPPPATCDDVRDTLVSPARQVPSIVPPNSLFDSHSFGRLHHMVQSLPDEGALSISNCEDESHLLQCEISEEDRWANSLSFPDIQGAVGESQDNRGSATSVIPSQQSIVLRETTETRPRKSSCLPSEHAVKALDTTGNVPDFVGSLDAFNQLVRSVVLPGERLSLRIVRSGKTLHVDNAPIDVASSRVMLANGIPLSICDKVAAVYDKPAEASPREEATSSAKARKSQRAIPLPGPEGWSAVDGIGKTYPHIDLQQFVKSNEQRVQAWNFGEYRILLSHDLLIFNSSAASVTNRNERILMKLRDLSKGYSDPEGDLKAWLDATMMSVDKVAYLFYDNGVPQEVQVFEKDKLPNLISAPQHKLFTCPEEVLHQGAKLFAFLQRECESSDEVYWLFRDEGSSHAALYSVSASSASTTLPHSAAGVAAVRDSPVAVPIALLCFRLGFACEKAASRVRAELTCSSAGGAIGLAEETIANVARNVSADEPESPLMAPNFGIDLSAVMPSVNTNEPQVGSVDSLNDTEDNGMEIEIAGNRSPQNKMKHLRELTESVNQLFMHAVLVLSNMESRQEIYSILLCLLNVLLRWDFESRRWLNAYKSDWRLETRLQLHMLQLLDQVIILLPCIIISDSITAGLREEGNNKDRSWFKFMSSKSLHLFVETCKRMASLFFAFRTFLLAEYPPGKLSAVKHDTIDWHLLRCGELWLVRGLSVMLQLTDGLSLDVVDRVSTSTVLDLVHLLELLGGVQFLLGNTKETKKHQRPLEILLNFFLGVVDSTGLDVPKFVTTRWIFHHGRRSVVTLDEIPSTSYGVLTYLLSMLVPTANDVAHRSEHSTVVGLSRRVPKKRTKSNKRTHKRKALYEQFQEIATCLPRLIQDRLALPSFCFALQLVVRTWNSISTNGSGEEKSLLAGHYRSLTLTLSRGLCRKMGSLYAENTALALARHDLRVDTLRRCESAYFVATCFFILAGDVDNIELILCNLCRVYRQSIGPYRAARPSGMYSCTEEDLGYYLKSLRTATTALCLVRLAASESSNPWLAGRHFQNATYELGFSALTAGVDLCQFISVNAALHPEVLVAAKHTTRDTAVQSEPGALGKDVINSIMTMPIYNAELAAILTDDPERSLMKQDVFSLLGVRWEKLPTASYAQPLDAKDVDSLPSGMADLSRVFLTKAQNIFLGMKDERESAVTHLHLAIHYHTLLVRGGAKTAARAESMLVHAHSALTYFASTVYLLDFSKTLIRTSTLELDALEWGLTQDVSTRAKLEEIVAMLIAGEFVMLRQDESIQEDFRFVYLKSNNAAMSLDEDCRCNTANNVVGSRAVRENLPNILRRLLTLQSDSNVVSLTTSIVNYDHPRMLCACNTGKSFEDTCFAVQLWLQHESWAGLKSIYRLILRQEKIHAISAAV